MSATRQHRSSSFPAPRLERSQLWQRHVSFQHRASGFPRWPTSFRCACVCARARAGLHVSAGAAVGSQGRAGPRAGDERPAERRQPRRILARVGRHPRPRPPQIPGAPFYPARLPAGPTFAGLDDDVEGSSESPVWWRRFDVFLVPAAVMVAGAGEVIAGLSR